jgi:hypothetical protein
MTTWCIWLINKDTTFFILHLSAYLIILQSISKSGTPGLVTQTEGATQPNNKNDRSWKRDEAFSIWSDALSQLSIRQPSDWRKKGKHWQTHRTCINQWIILVYMQILLDFKAIHFKFHDRVNQRPISFHRVIPRIMQGDKRFYALWWSVKLCPNRNKHPDWCKGLTSDRMHGQ